MSEEKTSQTAKTVGAKLSPEDLRRLEAACDKTGVGSSTLVRLGIYRVLAEFEETGAIRIGQPSESGIVRR